MQHTATQEQVQDKLKSASKIPTLSERSCIAAALAFQARCRARLLAWAFADPCVAACFKGVSQQSILSSRRGPSRLLCLPPTGAVHVEDFFELQRRGLLRPDSTNRAKVSFGHQLADRLSNDAKR